MHSTEHTQDKQSQHQQNLEPRRANRPEPKYLVRHNGFNRARRRQLAQLIARRARHELRWGRHEDEDGARKRQHGA